MKRFKNILLVVDPDRNSARALARAAELAERNRARLTVVDVIDELPGILGRVFNERQKAQMEKDTTRQRERALKQAVAPLARKGLDVACDVLRGRAFVEIIRQVRRAGYDLVVIAPEGKTRFQDHIFGSTSLHLMRKCPCPVWVVKPSRRRKYFRILAAVKCDHHPGRVDALNVKILQLATSLSAWDGSQLEVFSAWHLYGERFLREMSSRERRRLNAQTQKEYRQKVQALTGAFRQEGHEFKVSVRQGSAGRLIPRIVRRHQIDLIIMGTLSREGVAGLLIGNTAEEVLQQVDCSVLTVKPDGFVSPIR